MSPKLIALRAAGSVVTTIPWTSRMCSSTGTLRVNSMNTYTIRLISQLLDSRMTPMVKPRKVAATMPQTATSRVFRIPTVAATTCVSREV